MEEVRVGWGELRRQRELVEAHCWRRRGSQAGAQSRRHGHRENDAGLTCRGARRQESLAAVASRLVSQCQWSNAKCQASSDRARRRQRQRRCGR